LPALWVHANGEKKMEKSAGTVAREKGGNGGAEGRKSAPNSNDIVPQESGVKLRGGGNDG